MNVFRRPLIRANDRVLVCPRCGSRYYRNVGILRTDVIRNGAVLSLVTGSVCLCARCGAEFETTTEGTVDRASLRGPVSSGEPTASAVASAPRTEAPSQPRPQVLMTPREKPIV